MFRLLTESAFIQPIKITSKMRKITQLTVRAFLSRETLRVSNTYTDGSALYLHGNKIAQYFEGEIYISNAGWKTMTTKERLNALSHVTIVQRQGEWYLNGQLWDGSWICPRTMQPLFAATHDRQTATATPETEEVEFDITSEWMGSYSKPIYSVLHVNERGQLRDAEKVLEDSGIATREMYSDTEGEYKPNYFLVVRPEDMVRASAILCENYSLV